MRENVHLIFQWNFTPYRARRDATRRNETRRYQTRRESTAEAMANGERRSNKQQSTVSSDQSLLTVRNDKGRYIFSFGFSWRFLQDQALVGRVEFSGGSLAKARGKILTVNCQLFVGKSTQNTVGEHKSQLTVIIGGGCIRISYVGQSTVGRAEISGRSFTTAIEK